jgi:hypothetical protein
MTTLFGNGAPGTFHDTYQLNKLPNSSDNDHGRIRCYFVIDAGRSRPEGRKNKETFYV